MSYEHKNNRGSAFPNDKEGNENRPDFRGSINIEGELYYVAVWNANTREEGKPYLSIKIAKPQPKEEPEDNDGY